MIALSDHRTIEGICILSRVCFAPFAYMIPTTTTAPGTTTFATYNLWALRLS